MGTGGDDIEDLALGPAHSADESEADGAVLALTSRRPAGRGRRAPAAAAEDDDDGDDLDAAADEAVGTVPGTARVWIKTMGCAHNVADSEVMAGVLLSQGYRVTLDGAGGGSSNNNNKGDDDAKRRCDVILLNSCTVKDPSEQAVATLIREAHGLGKPVVIAGCVPSGQRNSKALLPAAPAPGTDSNSSNKQPRPPLAVGLLGVAQLARVAEVVEAAVRGESLALLGRGRGERALPGAELPQARRNPHVAIVPLSQGCLGSCTYCKTVHARGALSSYAPEQVEARVLAAARDPKVREVHLSSEDVGAYGRDRGTTLAALLARLTRALDLAAEEHGQLEEEDEGQGRRRRRPLHRVLLRVGMSNPPFLLRDGALDAVSESLRHPAVFTWLHLPVQSGDDGVLRRMNREYTRCDFEEVVAGLKARVPGLAVATDVIVGFPGEDEAAFEATLDLLRQHRFPSAHATKFYPRPGTPAARYRPRVPTQVQKARTAAAALVIEGRDLEAADAAGGGAAPAALPYSPYRAMVGTTQRVVVVDVAADGVSLVAHARNYAQVLLAPAPGLMGAVADVRLVSASRWSVRGEVVRVLFSPPLAEGGEEGDEGVEEGAASSSSGAAAARARVRAAREKRAAAAASKAAAAESSGGSGKDDADVAPAPRDQQQQQAESSSSAPPLPPTPPKHGRQQQSEEEEDGGDGRQKQQQLLRRRSPSSPLRSSSSAKLSEGLLSPAAAAAAAAAAAPARLTAAAAAAAAASTLLLLLAAAMLALGATTLRDLGRLA